MCDGQQILCKPFGIQARTIPARTFLSSGWNVQKDIVWARSSSLKQTHHKNQLQLTFFEMLYSVYHANCLQIFCVSTLLIKIPLNFSACSSERSARGQKIVRLPDGITVGYLKKGTKYTSKSTHAHETFRYRCMASQLWSYTPLRRIRQFIMHVHVISGHNTHIYERWEICRLCLVCLCFNTFGRCYTVIEI